LPEFRSVVLSYMDTLTLLGHRLMAFMALSLGLSENYFHDRYTREPLILFRLFNYPPATTGWGVGEHTDYGLLTILQQDDCGGLEVKTKQGWLSAPPIPRTFICNIGDMLDRMTGGMYRSTPHRVKNHPTKSRLSFPFFFDPNFSAEVKPIAGVQNIRDDKDRRWDRASVHLFQGTYGDYLLNKVSKVFPELAKKAL